MAPGDAGRVDASDGALERFGPATRAWFEANFEAATEVQSQGWRHIAAGQDALLVAPTGSGKTLAAFLWAIDRLSGLPEDATPGVRVLYVSPLKALVHDVERNLRSPLSGVRAAGEREGIDLRLPRVDVRTGDTPQRDRQRQVRDPGEILVTTPESLFLMLGSKARETLRTVETVIVDEIHALAPTKRGAHLALSLERLAALTGTGPQRIGLSATVRPLDEVARFLGGDRHVELVDASARPRVDLRIEVPMEDMENPPAVEPPAEPSGSLLGVMASRTGEGTGGGDRGTWAAIYPALLEEIRSHRSTLLFVNSRGLCERLAQRLNDLAGEELVLAHHGSVSHAKRAEIEEALKAGRLRALVATSSLELGIDMGAIDLVVLVESPGSVARGLQRVGRAGHGVGETSVGRIYPKFRGDLLECAVVADRMAAGDIEALRVPENALDVLAQQVVAACCDRPWPAAELGKLVRRAHPYRNLSEDALVATLDMLCGRFPGGELADLRPRLRWDRATDVLSARRGSELVSRLNAGTIPDRGTFSVRLGPEGPRIGELDGEMVYEPRTGDTFLLGTSSWRVEEITRDSVIVSPAPGEPGRLPFWKGEGPGRPLELGRALGQFTREVASRGREEAPAWLQERLPLSELAAANLSAYVHEQRDATGVVPSDRTIVVERFRDELGDWRVCVLSPFGSRVHAPWALALEEALSARAGIDAQVTWTDDGIVMRLADAEGLPSLTELLPEPEDVVERVTDRVGGTALFSALFRENAVRSLLVTRRRPDQRNPLWAQRLKTQALLATVRRHPSFPIVLETYRQALRDVFDLDGLVEVLRGIRSREIAVEEVETNSASPFARSLVFAYVAQYLYDGDTPLAERRAQALTLDRGLPRELLGQAELRELIDAGALSELEDELAGTAEGRRARDRDELHDLLRRVGDLTRDELLARVETSDPRPWLTELFDERRALEVRIDGESRWSAAEDAGLVRDALGVHVPGGLPADHLAPVDDALLVLLRRFARSHGPFHARDFASRYGLTTAQVEPALRLLEGTGEVVLGEIRPGGRELDWCDAEVLRRLKRRTLARLRKEVAAVDGPTLGRFLPRWHGLVETPRTGERLMEVVAQLEGVPLPWSSLHLELLPQRVAGFHLDALDLLAATGRVVWVGRGGLGPRDGRVALYRRERIAELFAPEELGPVPEDDLAKSLLDHLGGRGACFLFELERAVREDLPEVTPTEVEAALWELVWAGRVTNDTFQPLRTLGKSARKGKGAWRGSPAGGRWSRVEDLLADATDPTRRTLARAWSLLDRYGVVSREVVAAEELPGGFGPVYRVLRELEEAGRIRRGWFVEGLSGAQFASPGALDRLRGARIDEDSPGREPEVVALAAVDPAQPYGTLLPWPEIAEGAGSPRRSAGAWVGLVDGRVAWYLPASRRNLTLFTTGLEERRLDAALRLLAGLPRRGRKRLSLDRIDGVASLDSPHLERFLASGFERDYTSLVAAQETGGRPASSV